jgi:tetratricopeptide (TPR) repeat protein
MKFTLLVSIILAAGVSASSSHAQTADEVLAIQQSWDRINFTLSGSDQNDQMKALVGQCDTVIAALPEDPDAFIWCGIVNSTYAGMASSFSAMKYAKAARKDLEQAIELDPAALSGAAQTSLGTLYFKVPGWPIGFGSDDKAREYLLLGLTADPEGIVINYFYAEFLADNKEYELAKTHLKLASEATPRAGRSIADTGRQAQVQALTESVNGALAKR